MFTQLHKLNIFRRLLCCLGVAAARGCAWRRSDTQDKHTTWTRKCQNTHAGKTASLQLCLSITVVVMSSHRHQPRRHSHTPMCTVQRREMVQTTTAIELLATCYAQHRCGRQCRSRRCHMGLRYATIKQSVQLACVRACMRVGNACMCGCAHVCQSVTLSVSVYVYISMYVWAYVWFCVLVCVYIWVCLTVWVCVCVYVFIHVRVRVCVCVRVCIFSSLICTTHWHRPTIDDADLYIWRQRCSSWIIF